MLLRWDSTEAVAEAPAEQVAQRDDGDDRRTCVACLQYTPGSCADHRNALLATPQISRALAVLPQRCPAFSSTTTTRG